MKLLVAAILLGPIALKPDLAAEFAEKMKFFVLLDLIAEKMGPVLLGLTDL